MAPSGGRGRGSGWTPHCTRRLGEGVWIAIYTQAGETGEDELQAGEEGPEETMEEDNHWMQLLKDTFLNRNQLKIKMQKSKMQIREN